MSNPADYPYDTRLSVRCAPLTVVSVDHIAAAVTHSWFNQTLVRVNNSVVRMGVMQGEYHWHEHTDDDEFFSGTRARAVRHPHGRDREHRPD
jgi:hypothetical protein